MRQSMRLCGVRSECCGLMGDGGMGFEGVNLFPAALKTGRT
jgi:hypothetical protein